MSLFYIWQIHSIEACRIRRFNKRAQHWGRLQSPSERVRAKPTERVRAKPTEKEREREREGKEGATMKNVLTDALDSKTLKKIGLGHPLVQTNNRSIATYPGQIPLLHQGMQNLG